jgi:hypothetical protein
LWEYLVARIAKRKFSIGDKVQVIGVPPITFSSGARDTIGTKRLFKYMLWRTYTVRGLDKYGHIELCPDRLNSVWIEPEYLKLCSKGKKAR